MHLSAIKTYLSFLILILYTSFCKAQFLMDISDTSRQVHFNGYIQPQFQFAQAKGARTYNGGNFPDQVNNRFMLRRGRIRMEYLHLNTSDQPSLQFVLQFDGTERGVFIRDFWGRGFESKWNLFSFTTGMFARPFGYEVNLSSSDRESPERGRMSQILMRTERDLGVMVTFDPREKNHPLFRWKLDAGFFNGQGLTAFNDFDSYKDFISRISLRQDTSATLSFSGGVSYFNGGILQNSKYIYQVHLTNGSGFSVDSSLGNIGKKAPRKYYGADLQFRWKHRLGLSEIRTEYWKGRQTALASTSETPASLPDEPYYIRDFDGAFFYFLHKFHSHQLGIKYDWYDPNTKVAGTQIGKDGANVNETNVRYNTIGFGYIHHINRNLKVVIWYDRVKNEKTMLTGYLSDLRDDVFTCRMQFRF